MSGAEVTAFMCVSGLVASGRGISGHALIFQAGGACGSAFVYMNRNHLHADPSTIRFHLPLGRWAGTEDTGHAVLLVTTFLLRFGI